MADIYLAFASPDRENARTLFAALAARWSVWWDEDLVGSYPEVIEREIWAAKCIVPLWSEAARSSQGLHDEVRLARTRKIPIIPAWIETCEPPYPYGTYSGVDLTGWAGEPDHPEWRKLLRKLEKVAPPRARPRRPPSILDDRLNLPGVFVSVSSHETQLTPEDAITVLTTFGSKTVLLSAYDFLPERCNPARLDGLNDLMASGALVLMDSGNYEATRLEDKSWTPEALRRALEIAPHNLACSYDVLDVADTPDAAVAQVIEAVARDTTFTAAPIVPIIHARRQLGGGYDLGPLPEVLRRVAEHLEPPLLAIPERELGPGLIARAKTVRRIREALDSLPFYQPLHLLGTGNPWSIGLLAAAGADTFDGLEWCRVVVDRERHHLNHFQHFDFFQHQARVADSPATVAAADDDRVHYAGKAALHNLDYFEELGRRLHAYAGKDGLETLVTTLLGEANTRQVVQQMPELFA